jgi:Tol biopolymer transport system component
MRVPSAVLAALLSPFTAAMIFLGLAGTPGYADRGHVVIRAFEPDVSVNNAGQKAIIAWNGTEEVLILSTDLSAGAKAKVLEFLPLPSQPSEVELAEPQSFSAIQRLIAEHSPPTAAHYQRRGSRGGGAASPPPVEIVFHEKLDVHDITIAKTNDLDGFMSWVREFVTGQGGSLPGRGRDRFESVVRSYLARGYRYFVFDVIELTTEKKTVPPVRYRFASDHLFFPLLVSTLDKGYTQVSLFLLTPHRPAPESLSDGFSIGKYRRKAGLRIAADRDEAEPIQFWLENDDLERISDSVADLFEGWRKTCLTAVGYRGDVAGLTRDFVMSVAADRLSWDRSRRPRQEWRYGERRRLLPGSVNQIVWSPDGRRLCMSCYSVGVRDRSETVLTVADADGGPVTVITAAGRISAQCWAPDGNTLCYLGGQERNVWLADVSSSLSRQIIDLSDSETDPLPWRAPAWSTSGDWIAFAALGDLWVVRPDGSELRRTTQLPEATRGAKGGMSTPGGGRGVLEYSWSPEGDGLAYAHPDRDGLDGELRWTLRLYDPERDVTEVLLKGQEFSAFDEGPVWQPRGDRIAFAANGGSGEAVWVTSEEGLGKNAVSRLTGDGRFLWTPDGRAVIARGRFRDLARGYRAAVIDVHTDEVDLLPGSHFLCDPVTHFAAFSPRSSDLAIARGDEVYLTRLDGRKWRRLDFSLSSGKGAGGIGYSVGRREQYPSLDESGVAAKRPAPVSVRTHPEPHLGLLLAALPVAIAVGVLLAGRRARH